MPQSFCRTPQNRSERKSICPLRAKSRLSIQLSIHTIQFIHRHGISVQAGIIFGRKTKKVSPNERVPQLIAIVKTDKDESKRARAVEELRKFDPLTFPDIVLVLLDALAKDPKPVVRAESAQTLSKLRPVSQQIGLALEQATAKDGSWRVRLELVD